MNLNKTLLMLLPKVQSPELITQFKPVNLYTVLYKIITKTIANRLRPLMPKINKQNLTSFVAGQSISNNIVIAQEAMHSMRKSKGKMSWMALKIEIEKAYDNVRSDFFERYPNRGGIPNISSFDNLELCVFGFISCIM